MQSNDYQQLTENDLGRLARSWITPELAAEARLQRVSSLVGGEIVGRNGKDDFSGIVFPYYYPWDPKNLVLEVLRLDNPKHEIINGESKEKGKYLVAPGSLQRLYFPLKTDSSLLCNDGIPVILVEGEKKALALWRLAWHGLGDTATEPRFLPVGLRGVYGWRGKVGKVNHPDGSIENATGPIPDLKRITWKGRQITICFDANIKTNMQVKKAQQDLAKYLEIEGARVSFFKWPDVPAGTNGIDDLLGLVGPDHVLSLLKAVRPSKPTADQVANCQRHFESIGEDQYRLSFPSISTKFEVDRLRRESHELNGELCISCDLPGARTVNGVLSRGDFNFSSIRARSERAKILATQSRAFELDWFGMLEEFVLRVIDAERIGQPDINLRELERPAQDDELKIDGLYLSKRHPTILFGDGGSAKSYTSLYLAGKLAQNGLKVGFFDWELAGEDHRDRLERIFGEQMPDIIYVRCERPLVNEMDRLTRIVQNRKLDYCIIDSVAVSCNGAPESAEVASVYFRCLRHLQIGCLLIAHVNKSEDGDKKPFGSAFWHHLARSIWFTKASESDDNIMNIGFFHRKSNLKKIHQPTGFEITFTENKTIFKRSNPVNISDLAIQMTIRQRMKHLLKAGPMTPEAIAVEISADIESVRRTVRRHKTLFTVLNGGQLALLERDVS